MTLPEVGASQLLQPAPPAVHARKQLSAISSDEDGDTSKGQRERGVPSPIQDQVSLSKEAHTLATSNNQTSNNQSFQQSPSPFDR